MPASLVPRNEHTHTQPHKLQGYRVTPPAPPPYPCIGETYVLATGIARKHVIGGAFVFEIDFYHSLSLSLFFQCFDPTQLRLTQWQNPSSSVVRPFRQYSRF